MTTPTAITWVPRDYHVITHTQTSEVMLGTNGVREVTPDARFEQAGTTLRWLPNPKDPSGWSFDNIPQHVWDAIATGRCFLVEFGPLGPLTEHDVTLSSAG